MEDVPEGHGISASKMVGRLLGKNLLATKAWQAGKSDRKGRDEAAAKNENHEKMTKKIRSKGRMDGNR